MIARMETPTSANHRPVTDPVPADRLAAWVSAGIITQEQADRIAAHEASRTARQQTAPTTRASLLVEALGYVGGVVILVGAVLLATEFWEELGVAGRLAVVGGAASVMVVAGVAVPPRAGDQGRRLRAGLWAAATAAFAGFVGLLASDVLELSGTDAGLLTSAATAAVAVLLWWLRPTNLQHLVALVALASTVAYALTRISDAEYLPGTGIWAAGLVWFLLALGGLLRPRRFALTLGAAVAIVGALTIMSTDVGIALTLASAVAVIAMAVVMTDLVLLSVGAVGLLFALPIAVSTWFDGDFAVPVALLGAGVALVAVALWIARRRHRSDDGAEARPETSSEHPVRDGTAGDLSTARRRGCPRAVVVHDERCSPVNVPSEARKCSAAAPISAVGVSSLCSSSPRRHEVAMMLCCSACAGMAPSRRAAASRMRARSSMSATNSWKTSCS